VSVGWAAKANVLTRAKIRWRYAKFDELTWLEGMSTFRGAENPPSGILFFPVFGSGQPRPPTARSNAAATNV
jgi:hypothetical protein